MQRQWRERWEGADDEGKPWEPTWEPLEVFDPQAEHPEDTLQAYLRGEVAALKDKLPVRPTRSTDPTHGRRVLTRVWDNLHRQHRCWIHRAE